MLNDDMNKTVGLAIVTYGTNYGTYLQAYATQYIVNKLGFNTEVINIESVKKEVSKARKKYFIKQIFNLPELKSYANVIKGMVFEKINKKYRKYIQNRKQKFDNFRKENFIFSKVCESWKGLSCLCNNYSHVLVGSDQLWRPANIAGNFYTLNFVPDHIKKVAYATSFGLGQVRKNQEKSVKNFLNRIECLSVREESGAKIVENLTGRKIPVVCDPTMLLTKDEWGQLSGNNKIIEGKYILTYLLGDNKQHREFIKKLAQETGCKIVSLLHIAGYISKDKNFGDVLPKDIGPFEFLNLIKNAEYVCTDSFHGCVFTSIFNRKLFAFKRFSKTSKMSTNSRIYTLLSGLNIEDCLIEGHEDVAKCLQLNIDYDQLNTKICEKRENSLDYLKNSLYDNE